MNTLLETSAALDLTCEVCPASLFKVNGRLDSLTVGESLDILVGDDHQLRAMAIDIKAEGHCIEAVRRHGVHYILRVRKGQ